MGQPAGAPGRLHSKVGHPKRGITALCLVGLASSALGYLVGFIHKGYPLRTETIVREMRTLRTTTKAKIAMMARGSIVMVFAPVGSFWTEAVDR